jgi:glycosyltransferase involved in cell wall biosynthesis
MNNRRPMRVLLLTLRIPWPLTDGGAIATAKLAEYLQRSGQRVTLAALNTRKHHQPPEVMAPFVEAVYTTSIDTTPRPLPLLRNLLAGQKPYIAERFYSPTHERLLADVMRQAQPDIVQLEGAWLGQYIPALRRLSTAPIVYRAHNVEHEIWQRLAAHSPNPLKRWLYGRFSRQIERFEREMLQQIDALVPITQQDEAQLRQMGWEGPSRTVSAGIDPERLVAQPAAQHPLDLCFIGSLEWAPNVDGLAWFLADIWPKLRERWPSIRLTIAGKNPPANVLAWNHPGVTIAGEVPDAKAFLHSHGPLIIPLQSGSGMRLKLVEALALGKVILSTDVGAEGVPALHGQHLLRANDAFGFISALRELESQPELGPKLAKAGQQLAADTYTWPALNQHLLDFYWEVLEKSSTDD